MVLDDYFYRLTGGKGVDGKDVILELSEPVNSFDARTEAVFGLKYAESSSDGFEEKYFKKHEPESYDREYDREYSENDYVVESQFVTPKITKAERKTGKPSILVVDDDSSTLDLMKIYLMRDYEYAGFTNAKDGLFYLMDVTVDLIFFDCNIFVTSPEKTATMVKQYKLSQNVPIIYIGDDFELSLVSGKLPDEVSGTIKRPVSRGELQHILDKFITAENS